MIFPGLAIAAFSLIIWYMSSPKMSVCSLVIEVRIDKSAGAHLVASKRPPSPVSKIRNFGITSAVITIAAKNVVSKKVGLIDNFSAASFT